VLVAEVVVERVMRASESVDDAVARKPFWKERVVEVAFSPVPNLVNG
jgi:hypothetical protein